MEYIFDLIEGIIACFTANLSWDYLITTYWFLLFVEFPRYYLTDIIAVTRYGITWRSRRKSEEEARRALYLEMPLVTIMAPGKNEGKNLYHLMESLGEQTYRNFEVIIVDDGSDDATPLICAGLQKAGLIKHFFRMRERGGKASAANYGLEHAKGKYLVHIDADSSLDRDAIEQILLPFYMDRDVRGVGGCIKVRNVDDSMCSSMQALEYLRTIMVGRMATDMMGIFHIISGAFGAFETDTLRQLGGWDIGPGLDGDLTQKIRKAGYKVRFANKAVCLTNVPTKWRKLFVQRLRWSKSLIRFRIRKHRDILWSNRNFSFSNMLSNLDCIFFDCFCNYVWLFYIITLILSNAGRIFDIIIVGWLIRLSFSIVSFLVMQLVSERSRQERRLGALLVFHTLYMGYFLRIARLCGHTAELFWYSSYHDNWNPRKTSQVAQVEGI